jgi:hypothetical protein
MTGMVQTESEYHRLKEAKAEGERGGGEFENSECFGRSRRRMEASSGLVETFQSWLRGGRGGVVWELREADGRSEIQEATVGT